VRRRISFLVLLSLVIFPVAAAAQSVPGSSLDGLVGSAKLDALVGRVVASQQALRSMRADFVQVKRSALLLEDARSSGEFSYRAPDSVRWDYRGPDRMVVLIADGTVTTYYPAQARAEKLKISKKQRRFVRVLSGTQPLDDLTSDFTVTLVDGGGETPYLLKLQPVNALLKKRLSLVELKVDRRLFLPVAVEIREADGDSTRYEFDHLVINPDLDDSRFRLELGADVRVVAVDATAGVG
jgi:outer membrane lipoprotein carrier protein